MVVYARPEPLPEPLATETQRCAEKESWSALMRSTFGLDVLACVRCGGRMRYVATILDGRVACRILKHFGLSARALPELPARPAAVLAGGGGVELNVAAGTYGVFS